MDEAREQATLALEESEAAGDACTSAAALHDLAALAWRDGDVAGCMRLITRALPLVPVDSHPDEHAMLRRAEAAARVVQGCFDDACESLRVAEGALVAVGDPRQRALVLADLAEFSIWRGHLSEGWESAKLAMFLSEEVDDALGRVVSSRAAADAAFQLGCLSQATALARSAADRAERLGMRREVIAACATLQAVAIEQGHWPEAMRHGDRGLRAVGATRDLEQWGPVLSARQLWAGAGAGVQRVAALASFRAGLSSGLEPLRLVWADLALAEAACLCGGFDHAAAWARAALARARDCGLVSVQLAAHAVLARCPCEDRARHEEELHQLAATAGRGLSPGLREPFQARIRRLLLADRRQATGAADAG